MKKYKIRLIGDIHGDYEFYRQQVIAADKDGISTIQLGDFGLGFHLMRDLILTKESGIDWTSHKFIRGNHDDPECCDDHPGYLGDFGYIKEYDLFYISGAYSIDKDWRIEGVSWWPEEELSESQMQECARLYLETKPKYVISHDAPKEVIKNIYFKQDKGIERFPNRTSDFLQKLFEIHQPLFQFFGHHHQNLNIKIKNTNFVCIKDNDALTIEIPRIE